MNIDYFVECAVVAALPDGLLLVTLEEPGPYASQMIATVDEFTAWRESLDYDVSVVHNDIYLNDFAYGPKPDRRANGGYALAAA